MVIGSTDIKDIRQLDVICLDIKHQLRNRFTNNNTSFQVDAFRDNMSFKDIIRIIFHSADGTRHEVRQEHEYASTWGWVGLHDETIAKIMLLLG